VAPRTVERASRLEGKNFKTSISAEVSTMEAYLDPQSAFSALRRLVFSKDATLRQQQCSTRSPPCSADSTSAGIIKLGRVQLAGQQDSRLDFLQAVRVVEFLVLHCAGGDTPCEAERQGTATAIGGKSVATGDCHGRRSHHRRRHRAVPTLQTAPYLWSRLPTPCAAGPCPAQPLLGWYPMLRVCDEVEDHGIRVLSAERPNDGLKS